MAAVGEYIRVLREGQHISRTGLAGQLEVDPTTLWRVEEGKQEPSGSLLVSLVAAVRGSFDDVQRLLNSQGDDAPQGRELAELRLGREVSRVVNGFSVDELARVREELASDPDFLDAIAREVLRKRR